MTAVSRTRISPAALSCATLVVAVAAVVAAGAAAARAPGVPGGATLAELSDVAQLRTQFNADRGHVRVVLLLSPT